MPHFAEWSDDDLEDREFPDEEDDYGDESSETYPCPNCRAEIYEDAVQCTECGTYIDRNTGPWFGRSAWFVILGLLGIVAVIVAMTRN